MAVTRRELLAGGVGLTAGIAASSIFEPVPLQAQGPKFKLTVHYTGLCALVKTNTPPNVNNNDANFGRMYALLLKGNVLGIPEHVAYLKIRIPFVLNARQDFKKYVDGSFLKIPLAKQIVTFKLDGNTAMGDVKAKWRKDEAKLAYCPSAAEWEELTWLPNMDLIIPSGTKKVKGSHLTGDLTGTPIASRVEFGGGRMVAAFPSEPDFGKQKSEFSTGSDYHHIITDMVRHVSDEAEKIEIWFKAVDGGDVIPEMKLNPSFGAVEAYIENMIKPGMMHGNHHFKAYYGVLDNYNGDTYTPGAGTRCQAGGDPDWPIYCPPPLVSA